jgi:CheY-like chemotaxis protein
MKTILLVEDDPFIVDIYANQFKKEGYKVFVAKDGEMAVEKVTSVNPDIMLLDIGLPKMNGWEVLKIVRGDPATKDLKVVVLSNNNIKDFAPESVDFKVVKYFLKVQVSPQEITDYIKSVLK